MIEWKLIALDRNNREHEIDLLDSNSANTTLRETDSIQFVVSVDNETYIQSGSPYVIIGDVPLELEFQNYSGNDRIFASTEPLGQHSSRYFYNFFGESEIGLTFEKSEYLSTCTINILARSENAELAGEMLGYITDNLEDAVSICFSRSKISGGHDSANSFNFTRLDIVEKAVNFLSLNLPLFIRTHKHTWKPDMLLSDRGQPTGPDSVYWVLSHLDRLSPASQEESNLIYNNRSYRLDTLPKEVISNECDVFENRVIHTFLHNISLFLTELRDTFDKSSRVEHVYSDSEYVRFDHTMQRFTQLALKHKTRQLEHLLISVEQLRRQFVKALPSRITPGIQPKMTSYVVKHPHYRQAFELIDQCNSAPAPTFEGNSVLLGLKNLAIVYEISSLLILHDAIKRCFSVDQIEQSYRVHGQNLPFGGVEKARPFGEVNNYFAYRSDTFDIELFYEPQIYPFSSDSSLGDLVDTSDTRSTLKFGKHHYCPDFIVRVRSSRWKKPVIIVLDAKYKDSATIKKYDLAALTQKYLLNIHQLNSQGGLGVSPIQLLLVLFAHGRTGNAVRTVAARHCLTGALPVLPQSTAILLKPDDSARLDDHLKAMIDVMDKEYQ